MPLRRIVLQGAAALAGAAALLAIAVVLRGDFGETEEKLFATLAATFVAGAAAMAGIALLARQASRPVAYAGIVLAVGGYVLWVEQIWAGHDSDGYWKLLLLVLTWTLATLVVATNRLMLRSARLIGTLYPATAAAAVLAALTTTAMLWREEADGWQLFAVLLILTLLGEVLAPILERADTTGGDDAAERLLARVGGVEIVAVRGEPGAVVVEGRPYALREGEIVAVRSA